MYGLSKRVGIMRAISGLFNNCGRVFSVGSCDNNKKEKKEKEKEKGNYYNMEGMRIRKEA